MADTKQDTPKKPDAAALLSKLNSVQEACEKLAGTKGINPFIYIRDNITPLREKVVAGQIDDKLIAAVGALKAIEAPPVKK